MNQQTYLTWSKLPILICIWLIAMFSGLRSFAQPKPPKPFAIYTNPAQGLIFGAFFQGTLGGSVVLYPDGSRSTTGDIIGASLGYPFSPAIFEVEAELGQHISILNGPDVVLTGSNGGTLTLHIGSSNVGSPFISAVAPPGRTQVIIGGTLYVGNSLSNPVGSYSGTFSVTFIQE